MYYSMILDMPYRRIIGFDRIKTPARDDSGVLENPNHRKKNEKRESTATTRATAKSNPTTRDKD